ncbi:MAG: dihydroneopterin aldolase [bacterium]|nr:dihydroneopterin aldolase [bacterium]
MNPTQSTILIRGLAVRAHVGVGALERRAPQTVVVDVEIRLRDPSIARDHMHASVNYAAVIRGIEEVAIMERAVLLETLAERIASQIFKDGRVADVTLTITKPRKIPNCDAVGVRRTFQNDGAHHGST